MLREFTQPELIGALLTWLDEHGVKEMNARQLDAVIKAADAVIEAIDRPHQPAVPASGLLQWLASDDTGVSSRYMAAALAAAAGRTFYPGLAGYEYRDPYPHDPGDFGRCVRLLDAAPELRPHLAALADPRHGPVWNAITAEWETLEAWYRMDLSTGRSDRLYARLRELIDAAHKPAGAA
jgi:hypothetical protein